MATVRVTVVLPVVAAPRRCWSLQKWCGEAVLPKHLLSSVDLPVVGVVVGAAAAVPRVAGGAVGVVTSAAVVEVDNRDGNWKLLLQLTP